MSGNTYSEYLKIREAADFLGVSTGVLRVWEKTKKLECIRHPKTKYRLYKISILQKFRDSRKRKYNKTEK
jgi:predicted site-specific integrase-resolvase